jgi:hypothetical protein
MSWSKEQKCPHCDYTATYTGNAHGDITVRGSHGAFFHMEARMTREEQYAPKEVASLLACPLCCKTFIDHQPRRKYGGN